MLVDAWAKRYYLLQKVHRLTGRRKYGAWFWGTYWDAQSRAMHDPDAWTWTVSVQTWNPSTGRVASADPASAERVARGDTSGPTGALDLRTFIAQASRPPGAP